MALIPAAEVAMISVISMGFKKVDMKQAFTFFVLLLGLLNSCGAQPAGTASLDSKQKLIEQKIRLLDMLINSPAAKKAAESHDVNSAGLIAKGRLTFEAAKQALAEQRLDDASRMLDESIKATSAAARKLSASGSELSESAQRKSLADMAAQVATYRVAVVDLTRDNKLAVEARQLLQRMDALSAESRQLAEAGKLGDANKKLAAAYKLSLEEISRMRAGQEIIMSLQFETPADEYAYEQKRFGSNLSMVDMLIVEGRAEGQKRPLVDGFVMEGNKLKNQADTEAIGGRYKEAVTLMEKATGQLNRALQSMGIPVF